MKKTAASVLGLCMFAAALPALAQKNDGARPAPKVIQIWREVVKPGRGPAHEANEAAWAKTYRSSKTPPRYIAMTTIAGPTEAWFVGGHESFDAIEKQMKAEEGDAALTAQTNRLSATDGEMLENVRVIIARFRDDLSHRPSLNIGDYRYMHVITVRVRPGTQGKFTELRKIIKAAHEKNAMTDYFSVFEVQSGMAAPTYLVFIPMKSLKEMDETGPLHTSAAYVEAVGGEEGQKKMAEISNTAILNTESMVFRFNPKMSVPMPEYAIGNEEFWNPKPASTKAKAAGN